MRFGFKKNSHEIAPDEIFLDSSNLPAHESSQFEGRVAKPISSRAIFAVGVVFSFIALAFAGRAFSLQILQGSQLADVSRLNTLSRSVVFALRGAIYDRTGRELAWNVSQQGVSQASSTEATAAGKTFALRKYTSLPGLSHLLGYIQYPQRDSHGNWWRTTYLPITGVELAFNEELAGVNGSSMVERDAHGVIRRENLVAPPQDGKTLTLSIDADVQSELFKALTAGAAVDGFQGGAGVIMNVHNGALLALTSFPEYSNQAFADGNAQAVSAAVHDPRNPLLNRAISGLYTPGSIVKPMFAAGALDAGIISPTTIIVSKGYLSVPNPYDPGHPSIFNDWTAHGPIDMKTAIAVSSDEYFYTIGGGYGDQRGLGIAGLDKYAKIFGFGAKTGIALQGEVSGVIPSPKWKARVFNGQPWLLGDTYHTAIGQYGFQVTPIQAARYAAAIANDGKLLTPKLTLHPSPEFTTIPIPDADLAVARAGMRLAVTSSRPDATVNEFQIPGIDLAAKTGTAQLGDHNQWVNSWVIGFWPADAPKYAFAVVLEKGPASETHNAAESMAPFFRWLVANHPEYLK